MRRLAALLFSAALTVLLLPAPAHAEVDGVRLTVTKVPDEFKAGDDPDIVEVVVSTDNGGRCQKVRWSLVVGVEGADPGQVRVNRVEENGTFPTQTRSEDGKTRITDTQFDPGALCRGRTVTGRYLVSVVGGAPDGEVTFESEAFDARGRLLQRAGASSDITGVEKPSPAPTTKEPSEEPSEEPSDDPTEEPAAPPVADTSAPPAGELASGQSSTPSLLGPGLIVGAVLVFIGVGLLLRLRLRNRPKRQQLPNYARY